MSRRMTWGELRLFSLTFIVGFAIGVVFLGPVIGTKQASSPIPWEPFKSADPFEGVSPSPSNTASPGVDTSGSTVALGPTVSPTPSPTASAKPEPSASPTKAPKPRPSTSSRGQNRISGPARWEAGNWDRFPGWVENVAWCVAHGESWTVGLWLADNTATDGNGNQLSTASGFAQWIDGSWEVQTDRAGVGQGYGRAKYAPPATQAAVFAYQVMNHGVYPWGSRCKGEMRR